MLPNNKVAPDATLAWDTILPHVSASQKSLSLKFAEPSIENNYMRSRTTAGYPRAFVLLLALALLERSLWFGSLSDDSPQYDASSTRMMAAGVCMIAVQTMGLFLAVPVARLGTTISQTAAALVTPGWYTSLWTTAAVTMCTTGAVRSVTVAAGDEACLATASFCASQSRLANSVLTAPINLAVGVLLALPAVRTPFVVMAPCATWLLGLVVSSVLQSTSGFFAAGEAVVLSVCLWVGGLALCFLEEYRTRLRFAMELQLEGLGARAKRAAQRMEWFRTGALEANRITRPPIIDSSEITFQESIGTGGFGDVMKAQWQSMTVAVKILRAGVTQDIMMEFGGEAAIMVAIRHPHIVLFMGISFLQTGSCALVLEYMQHGSLYRVLHQRGPRHSKLHWTLRLRMALDAALGLKHLHSCEPSVIHGDVKSHNLLVNSDWHVKVADFGVSRLQKLVANQTEDPGAGAADAAESASEPTVLAASIPWSAPEILAQDHPVTEASDVYSFGVTLFELVYYQIPYRSKPAYNIPLCVLQGQRPHHFEQRPSSMPAALSQLDGIMKDCVQQEPRLRPSFDDLVLALIAITESQPDKSVKLPHGSHGLSKNGAGSSENDSNALQNRMAGFTLKFSDLTMGPTVGRGAFGEVYEGLYHGTHVAVKKLHMQGSTLTDRALRLFHRECEVMQQLRHPNIVLFMGLCVDEERVCMVTELMEFGSLYFLYQSTPLADVCIRPGSQRTPEDQFADVMLHVASDACKGLAYLHSRSPKLAHRDLKSPNILIDSTWTCKIADFGLSRIMETDVMTMTNCGSPLWVAPEVLRHEPVSELCDIYSLGIICWELFHWKEPYQALTVLNVVQGVAQGTTRPEIRRDCPPAFARLMRQMWDEDPTKRPNAETVLRRLNKMRSAAVRNRAAPTAAPTPAPAPVLPSTAPLSAPVASLSEVRRAMEVEELV